MARKTVKNRSSVAQLADPMARKTVKNRSPVAQLVEYRAVTREVMSSTPAGPTLGVFK